MDHDINAEGNKRPFEDDFVTPNNPVLDGAPAPMDAKQDAAAHVLQHTEQALAHFANEIEAVFQSIDASTPATPASFVEYWARIHSLGSEMAPYANMIPSQLGHRWDTVRTRIQEALKKANDIWREKLGGPPISDEQLKYYYELLDAGVKKFHALATLPLDPAALEVFQRWCARVQRMRDFRKAELMAKWTEMNNTYATVLTPVDKDTMDRAVNISSDLKWYLSVWEYDDVLSTLQFIKWNFASTCEREAAERKQAEEAKERLAESNQRLADTKVQLQLQTSYTQYVQTHIARAAEAAKSSQLRGYTSGAQGTLMYHDAPLLANTPYITTSTSSSGHSQQLTTPKWDKAAVDNVMAMCNRHHELRKQ